MHECIIATYWSGRSQQGHSSSRVGLTVARSRQRMATSCDNT